MKQCNRLHHLHTFYSEVKTFSEATLKQGNDVEPRGSFFSLVSSTRDEIIIFILKLKQTNKKQTLELSGKIRKHVFLFFRAVITLYDCG